MEHITHLLGQWREGNDDALVTLMNELQTELRRLAQKQLDKDRRNHTLSPTDLVSELYLRIHTGITVDWADRAHFYAICSRVIRRILTDHARKRSRSLQKDAKMSLSLAEEMVSDDEAGSLKLIDLLDLDRALEQLKEGDPMQYQVVEMRFFAGLGLTEIAEVLGVTNRTVQRKWAAARIWLLRALKES